MSKVVLVACDVRDPASHNICNICAERVWNHWLEQPCGTQPIRNHCFQPVWNLFGTGLRPVWSPFGARLEPVWKPPGSCLEAVWKPSGNHLEAIVTRRSRLEIAWSCRQPCLAPCLEPFLEPCLPFGSRLKPVQNV